MKKELMTLRAAAAVLGVPAHDVVYAITSGKAEEPLRISGRRMFSATDIENLRRTISLRKEGHHGK